MALSSTSTRQLYGMDFGSISLAGGNDPPLIDTNLTGTSGFIGVLNTARAQGSAVMLKFTGASSAVQDSSSVFSMAKWKAAMDTAFAKATNATMASYVTDGTLVANYMLDDFKTGGNVFAPPYPTYADFEEMAQYSKSVWPSVPCTARAENGYFESRASGSRYTYLDFGWAQWVARFGPYETYITNHINAGKRIGLGALIGFNLINGGSGLTAPWNTHPGSASKFGMSPQEIDAVGATFTAHRNDIIGVYSWSANPTFDTTNYYQIQSIQTALQALVNRAIGKTRGPLNYHTGSVTTGSGGTVQGFWSLVEVADSNRKDGSTALSVSMPTTASPGNLVGLITYSRDSIQRSIDTPSNWSLAKKVSGNSAQGGELALWYRLAQSGDPTTESLTFSGTGGVGAVVAATAFAFSGNTTKQANLLATAGSTRSWIASTSMGPVAGQQSARSDALLLCIAARTNDFDNTNLPPFTTMSATTAATETWNRALMVGSSTGNDIGYFMDYAPLSGQPSIDSKSWTQLSGSQSGTGVGFMVSFTPTLVTAGTPPALPELEDVTFSISSGLSFTLVSTGSTPITYSLVSGPSNVTLGSSTGQFVWSPLATGSYYLILRATNSFGSDTDDFTATVVPSSTSTSGVSVTNSPPVITNPGDRTVNLMQRLNVPIIATDPDGDTIAWSLDPGSPEGATVEMSTGVFDWTPVGDQAGVYGIVAIASDGQNESRSTFTVSVLGAPWTKVLGPHLGPPGNQFRRL